MKKITNLLSFTLGIAFNVLLLVVLAIGIYHVANRGYLFGREFAEVLTGEGDDAEIVFVLSERTRNTDVARQLQEQGIIDNTMLFRLELMIFGGETYYEPGTFFLRNNMTSVQIDRTLRGQAGATATGQPATQVRVTIREGWTQRRIGQYLEERGFFTAEEFNYVANHHPFEHRFLENLPTEGRPYRLEGYLFPDTYYIMSNATPVQVINMMLNRFNAIYTISWQMRTAEIGMTIDEIITLASIIEREVRVASERPKVAAVMYNRMRTHPDRTHFPNYVMMLQMDATVVYAWFLEGEIVDRVLYSHLDIVSPFNTYRNHGLPIGPIANPGAASIEAALFPANVPYLFYVLGDLTTGAHNFATTLAQHHFYVSILQGLMRG